MLLQDNVGTVLDQVKRGSQIKDATYDTNGNFTGFTIALGNAQISDGILFRNIQFKPTSQDVSLPHNLGRAANFIVVNRNGPGWVSLSGSIFANTVDPKVTLVLILNPVGGASLTANIWCF